MYRLNHSISMYVLNNLRLDRKILKTDPNLYLTFQEVDLWQILPLKKMCQEYDFFPMRQGSSFGLIIPKTTKNLVCQFRYLYKGG